MYFYDNVSWVKRKTALEQKCTQMQKPCLNALQSKEETPDDKGGFLINAANSADRLCCNSSTSNHKYNGKKRQE